MRESRGVVWGSTRGYRGTDPERQTGPAGSSPGLCRDTSGGADTGAAGTWREEFLTDDGGLRPSFRDAEDPRGGFSKRGFASVSLSQEPH